MSNGVKRIEIEVKDTSSFYYGCKVYRVEAARWSSRATFQEKCPICDGIKSIDIKGWNVKCPLCQSNELSHSMVSISLAKYVVSEYIINRFEISGPTYKNAYSGEGLLRRCNLPNIRWFGFAKHGNGYNDVQSREFSEYDLRGSDPEKADIIHGADGACFLSPTDALRYCKRLHERQKEMLDLFNAKHGTSHQYPWEY